MSEIIDVPSEDKAWLEKVGQITKTEKPKPVSKLSMYSNWAWQSFTADCAPFLIDTTG